MSDYTVLEARGMSNIADGREFIVTKPVRRYGPPTDDNQVFLRPVEGNYPKEVSAISEDSPFSCGDCGDVFSRVLVGHTLTWMYSVFSCASHRYETALLDVFPKLLLDPGHDWHNAFMGLETRSVAEQDLAIRAIEGYRPPDEWAKEYREQAKGHYVITPEGIRKERTRLWRPGWLLRLTISGE